ncbi:MAG: ATP phosphoribosyltransferase regulatory subunit [Syntrophomonadaceae bacterium]|jgi:ATP phosphoribosyltransferase regulatory subunit|nr:ATP phosphoribosyltransferase regulatory subunit [Syntrophomonadaceae bacterium]
MRNRQIPKGLRDLLPDEVKVLRSMEKKAARLFSSYAYEEVMTPTFEFLEVIEAGRGSRREDLFLFMDREGGILSLRPEVTGSIARMASIHLHDSDFPRRLFYTANVFRHVQPQLAQYREFRQTGVELLGAAGIWADAEVINIAVKLLETMGLENFKISINQLPIFNSLLDDSGLNMEDRRLVRQLVEEKDLVELYRLLEGLDIDDELKDTIAALPVLHGGLDVIQRIPYVEKNRKASAAVGELIKIYDALKLYGTTEHIVVDMGVLRNLDYYTGLVFEGYSPDLGYGLLGGGRYDNLLGQFGLSCPATGFALHMDRLALVLKCRDEERNHYLVGGGSYPAMIGQAQKLREQGYAVEMDLEEHSRAELEKKIEGKDNWTLVYLD